MSGCRRYYFSLFPFLDNSWTCAPFLANAPTDGESEFEEERCGEGRIKQKAYLVKATTRLMICVKRMRWDGRLVQKNLLYLTSD
jgi:hypothetical protein